MTTTTRSNTRPLTLLELAGFGPRGIAERERLAAEAAAKAASGAPPPPPPPTMPSVDYNRLTREDAEICARALGVELPTTMYSDHSVRAPVNAERSARRCERFLRRLGEFRSHEARARAAMLDAGRVDGANASGTQIRDRLAQLGLDPVLGSGINDRATPRLGTGDGDENPFLVESERATSAQRDIDRLVVERVRQAVRRGEPVAATALTEAQRQLLAGFGVTLR